MMSRFLIVLIERIRDARGYLSNHNNALGGRIVIAYINMGGSYDEIPQTMKIPDRSHVVAIGGDLRKIDVVREFWKLAINTLEDSPPALWINFTTVASADTKTRRMYRCHLTSCKGNGRAGLHHWLKSCLRSLASVQVSPT